MAPAPLRRATTEDLLSLVALPSVMAGQMSLRTKKNRKSSGRSPLASEGQVISRLFSSEGPRPYPNNGLSLEQTIQLEMTQQASFLTASATAGVPTFASSTFKLSDFVGSASLLAVFDQYRFDQIEVWIESLTPNLTGALPYLTTAVDLDDANVPTNAGQVQDKMGAVSGFSLGGHYHRFKPHVAISVYSGTFTSFGNAASQWIDNASPNVQHFGVKAAAVSSGTVVTYNITWRAVVSLRAPGVV